MTYQDQIREGMTVFLGEPGELNRKMTWKVLRIDQASENATYATIVSGSSGQTRRVPIERLTPFRVTEEAA